MHPLNAARDELNDARAHYARLRRELGVLTRMSNRGAYPELARPMARYRSNLFGDLNRARARLKRAIKRVEGLLKTRPTLVQSLQARPAHRVHRLPAKVIAVHKGIVVFQ